jgi:hypothetical protein
MLNSKSVTLFRVRVPFVEGVIGYIERSGEAATERSSSTARVTLGWSEQRVLTHPHSLQKEKRIR